MPKNKDTRKPAEIKQDYRCGMSYLKALLKELETMVKHGQRPDPKKVGDDLMPIYEHLIMSQDEPWEVFDFENPETRFWQEVRRSEEKRGEVTTNGTN